MLKWLIGNYCSIKLTIEIYMCWVGKPSQSFRYIIVSSKTYRLWCGNKWCGTKVARKWQSLSFSRKINSCNRFLGSKNIKNEPKLDEIVWNIDVQFFHQEMQTRIRAWPFLEKLKVLCSWNLDPSNLMWSFWFIWCGYWAPCDLPKPSYVQFKLYINEWISKPPKKVSPRVWFWPFFLVILETI